ncbi:outer membrane protein [Helicobacter bizzozeronii CIII-1]|uniref:Outer membrane protein n=2 Tax=Helicobacter bizzozeronii TaxID=56877 RepID=F8KSA2_HELBC|nr:outer membrane family protein [Helicobacter bizzozeronii]CCB79666.1 outer membrane protein [Helicobacter bizzozeronii CIII-1]SFZ71889.1 OMP688 [Helicobacter bizzozeronii]
MKDLVALLRGALCGVCCVDLMGAFSYKLSGVAESVSKVGFNHSPINSAKGIFPTESFVSMTLKVQADATLLNKNGHQITTGIGGSVGQMAYDSTKNLIDQSTGQVYGSKLYYYMGRYWGFLDNVPWKKSNVISTRNAKPYVLYNLFVKYDYKGILTFIGGRYLAKTTFLSGYTEGFEISYKFSYFRLRWFSSFGRALAVGEFIRPWYAPITTTNKKGEDVDLGIHAVGINYDTRHFSLVPFVYFSPNTYTTPGFKLHYDSNPAFDGVGFKSLTEMTVIFPIYSPHLADTWYRGTQLGKGGVSIYIRQRFDWNQYNFGGGYYQNIGNPNAKIGWYGSPIGIDYRDASVYGGLMDNMLSPNAITGFIFWGGVYRKLFWGLVGRLTFSPRANEKSVAFNIGIKWNRYLSSNIKIEYHEVYTHKGYNIAQWYTRDYSVGATDQDRSFLMTSIKAQF